MDDDLREHLERLDELIDHYWDLSPSGRRMGEEEVRAVCIALLGLEDEPPRAWMS